MTYDPVDTNDDGVVDADVDNQSVNTDDSVTVTTGEATDTLHYGSNQDRANAGDQSVALGIGARANGDDGSGGSISQHVAVGYQAARDNTGGSVTASGYRAAENNTGFGVTASGYQAARDNTGGSVTASGYRAAENNTGFGVTASGYQAARDNTGGSVTASGYQAAENNTGFGVTASGYQAARDNTGGSVTASGYRAAENNTGFGVAASGFRAAENNTGGSVTASGYQAARDNTGFGVAASGFRAAENNTGNRVTASGYQAARGDGLADPTTMGDDNIGIGENAIRNNQASGLIAIGQDAGINAQTDDQLIITDRNGNRRLVMDLTTGDLSIEGTLTESASL